MTPGEMMIRINEQEREIKRLREELQGQKDLTVGIGNAEFLRREEIATLESRLAIERDRNANLFMAWQKTELRPPGSVELRGRDAKLVSRVLETYYKTYRGPERVRLDALIAKLKEARDE